MNYKLTQVCKCALAELVGLLAGFILWLKNWLGCTLSLKNGHGLNSDRSSAMVSSSPKMWSHHRTMSNFIHISAICLNNCCESVGWRFAFYLITIQTTGLLLHHTLARFPANLTL